MSSRAWIAVSVAVSALPAFAQPPAPQSELPAPQLMVTSLGGGAYVVEGGRTPFNHVNTGFVVGDKGVIAIDAQAFPFIARQEVAEIAKITTKPVDTVIITHSDSDHINGLPGFPAGARVIAQENADTEMHAILTDPHPRGGTPPVELKNYMPAHTIRRSETLLVDGVQVVLTHVGRGHTDGDLLIYLPSQKIVFGGDIITFRAAGIPQNGIYPVIHLNKNGSSAGWIATVKYMLTLDADKFVGGHGNAVWDRASMVEMLHLTEQRRADIKKLFDEGKSLAEIKVALGESDPAARYPTFTETTYQELLQQ